MKTTIGILLAFTTSTSYLAAEDVVRWSEDAPFANSFHFKGFEYRVILNKHFSLAVDRPSTFGRYTMFNAIFENTDLPRIDVAPEQLSCLCLDKNGAMKALKYYRPTFKVDGLFLANTVSPSERIAGTVSFKGKCKRYVIRWEVPDTTPKKLLEFTF